MLRSDKQTCGHDLKVSGEKASKYKSEGNFSHIKKLLIACDRCHMMTKIQRFPFTRYISNATGLHVQRIVTKRLPFLGMNILKIFLLSRVGNCAFLVANATKNFALATRISQLVATFSHLATEKKRFVASWRLPKKVNFRPCN